VSFIGDRSQLRFKIEKAIEGVWFAPPMAFRNFWFRAAYAGPDTMTRRIIIMPTGIAL
jgi:hypothetical protein